MASSTQQLPAFEHEAFDQSSKEVMVALLDMGGRLFSRGEQEHAMRMFDAAFSGLKTSSQEAEVILAAQITLANQKLSQSQSPTCIRYPVDTYEEDECDVGPRPFCEPVTPRSSLDSSLLTLYVCYNKGLVHHAQNEISEATQMYCAVVSQINSLVAKSSSQLSYIAMRAHNNMGQICYAERAEDTALFHFERALDFAKQVANNSDSHQLDCANILSNWCRVHWMMGDISDTVLEGLKQVLAIRFSVLGWDHVDVASARFNLGMAEYARQNQAEAMGHLMEYLRISSYRVKENKATELDPIPALTYVLLIKNDDNEDKTSQDLTRGLRALQEKRQEFGPNSLDVAAVHNYIGTLLFHQRELDHALIFFQEQLRLEEDFCESDDDVSVSVACNNIGRILQELGRFPEAIHFYHRSVKSEFGEIEKDGKDFFKPSGRIERTINARIENSCDAGEILPATMNLYSTVWYNVGLIHDKMGAYADAIKSFQISLTLRRAMLGPDHPDVACLLYNIGVLQMEQQGLNDATDSFREALRIHRVTPTGQLNDRHVVKTLQKLAALHKSKGNVAGALEAYNEVLHVLKVSDDVVPDFRNKDMGVTMREIAELHHAQGDLVSALALAAESREMIRSCAGVAYDSTCIEQEAAALLLIGSIQHELCEPMLAQVSFAEAVDVISSNALLYSHTFVNGFGSLLPMLEVSNLLAATHVAPQA